MLTCEEYYKVKRDLYIATNLIKEYESQTPEIKLENAIEHFNRLGGTISPVKNVCKFKVKNKFVITIPTKNKIIEYYVFEDLSTAKFRYKLVCNSGTYQSINHIIEFLIDKLSSKGQI